MQIRNNQVIFQWIYNVFSDQIFQNVHRQKARLSIYFKTRGRVSETRDLWGFDDLRENQKLDLEFENFKFL